jgi:SAM-dependent methyltransferase
MVVAVRATDLAAGELVGFVGRFAAVGRVRLLEVGCGRGELAAALLAHGYDVMAVDRDSDAVATTRAKGVPAQEADFLTFTGGPYDVVVLSRALHEMGNVEKALAQVERVLAPGGILVVDEFARDWVDGGTASFFYDTCYLLGGTGVLKPPEGREDEDPLMRWEREYGRRRSNARPGASEIVDRVRERFEVLVTEEHPYLYRHIGQWLLDDEPGPTVVRRLREVEIRRIARGDVRPIGLRLSARMQQVS